MSNDDRHVVSAILARYDIPGPCRPLKATGIANRIYATADVVIRIATNHEDAVADARTESVAAPVARAVGVLVPQLLVFDDSRTLLPRPYSIWERVQGETLGLLPPDARRRPRTWIDLGRQLALLHTRVEACPDPLGWLDQPDRESDLSERAEALASKLDLTTARQLASWIEKLEPFIAESVTPRFLHNDIHEMNLMCHSGGELLAVIDWGDAGWGDPALEFAQMPLPAIPFALDAYNTHAPGYLGEAVEARILWDQLGYVLEALPDDPGPLNNLQHFISTANARWRHLL